MAEWLKAHAWKACKRETVSGVRIPSSPHFLHVNYNLLKLKILQKSLNLNMLKKFNNAQGILIIAFLIVCVNIIKLLIENNLNSEELSRLFFLQCILLLAVYIFRKR